MARSINGVIIPAELALLSDDQLRQALRHNNSATDRDTLIAMLLSILAAPRPAVRRAPTVSPSPGAARVKKHRLVSLLLQSNNDEDLAHALLTLDVDTMLARYCTADELHAAYAGNKQVRVRQVTQYSEEDTSMLAPGEYFNDDGDIVAAYSTRWATV